MFTGRSHENGQVVRIETINAQGSTIPTQVAPSTFFQTRLDRLSRADPAGLLPPALSPSIPLPLDTTPSPSDY